MTKEEYNKIADAIAQEVKSKSTPKGMKVRTLLGRFEIKKRDNKNTKLITKLFDDRNIKIIPSIIPKGKNWELSMDDRITMSIQEIITVVSKKSKSIPLDIQNDYDWFDEIQNKEYRNEKEVEIRFVVPLLSKLGYHEEDRIDDMPIDAYYGKTVRKIRADFILFNKSLKGQVLLVVEVKDDNHTLDIAQKQAISYALWEKCYFCLVTDGKKIQVLNLYISKPRDPKVVFECMRSELKTQFKKLYKLISKESLTEFYKSKVI